MKEKFLKSELNHDQGNYERDVKEFLNCMDKTIKLLDIDPLFSEIELFDFIDLKEIASYILKDQNLFKEHSNFLFEFIKDIMT